MGFGLDLYEALLVPANYSKITLSLFGGVKPSLQHRRQTQGNHPISSVAQRYNRAPGAPSFSFGSQQKFFTVHCLAFTAAHRVVSGSAQFTKRRSRTLFTSPNIKNVDNVFEPPALISGSGMPTTGILPTTIPIFTNK